MPFRIFEFLKMGKRLFFLQKIMVSIILLLPFNNLQAQDPSLLGFPGLLHTPTAYLSDWKSLYFGMTHYPAATSFTFEPGESMERSYWTHLGFLPFGEVSIRLTKPYNSSDKNYGIGDRSISFRLQVLKAVSYTHLTLPTTPYV